MANSAMSSGVRMESNQEYETFDGGCQCSLVRYRITLPKSRKVVIDGVEYPYASYCHCSTCRRTYSTITHAALSIPLSCIQYASRIPYTTSQASPDSIVDNQVASLPVTADELPPSYDTATIDYTGARPTTRARGQSAVSTSSTDTRPSIQRELSFVNVSTPRGCCTSDGVNDTPMGNGNSQKKREAPLPSPMAIEPPRRSYFSPHVRRRGDLSSPPPPHPPPTSLSLIGGGVENPIYTGVIQARDKGKGKENRKSNEKGPSSPTAQSNTLVAGRATTQNTINPLQLATAQQDGSNATPRGNSGISAALSSPASPQNPPGYQPNHPISPKASPQARGINIGPASKQVFVPHPYKEYPSPTAPGTFRGFCGHCSGGLVYREGSSPNVIDIPMGSLDNPEVLLTMEGMVVRETWCSKRLPEETETGLGVIGDSRGGSELAKGKDKGKGKIDSRNVGSVVRYRYGSRDGEIL